MDAREIITCLMKTLKGPSLLVVAYDYDKFWRNLSSFHSFSRPHVHESSTSCKAASFRTSSGMLNHNVGAGMEGSWSYTLDIFWSKVNSWIDTMFCLSILQDRSFGSCTSCTSCTTLLSVTRRSFFVLYNHASIKVFIWPHDIVDFDKLQAVVIVEMEVCQRNFIAGLNALDFNELQIVKSTSMPGSCRPLIIGEKVEVDL